MKIASNSKQSPAFHTFRAAQRAETAALATAGMAALCTALLAGAGLILGQPLLLFVTGVGAGAYCAVLGERYDQALSKQEMLKPHI